MAVLNECWYWQAEISHKICQRLMNLGKGKWSPAQLLESVNENESLHDVRKSDVVWTDEQCIYDLITPYMFTANDHAGWKYNITAGQSCQITRYTKGGFYTWHKDGIGSHNEVTNEPDDKMLHGSTRKLSMSIVLNSNFEGGDFEISKDKNKVPRLEGGSVIIFPSFIEHRVTPVTKGTRYSLVAWFAGPPFR